MDMSQRYFVQGVDFGYHQGVVNPTMMAQKVQFAAIRMGDGNQTPILDSQFRSNWSKFKGVLPRLPWYYFRGNKDPVAQAAVIIDGLRADPGELPFHLDLELRDPYYVAVSQPVYKTNVLTFIRTVEQALPRVLVGFYSSASFWLELFGPTGLGIVDMAKRSKWVAHWDAYSPICPTEWHGAWDFWQWHVLKDPTWALVKPYGVNSAALDLDLYRGTPTEFASRYNIVIVPPVPPVLPTYKRITITATTGQVRSLPTSTVSGLVLGTLARGSIWPVQSIVAGGDGNWVKVTEGVYIAAWLGELS